MLTARVTVTKVVPPHWAAALLAGTAAAAEEAIGATTAGFPPVLAADLVPSRATEVKLENPWAFITSATLNPAAANGVLTDVAEFAFSTSWPATAGSISGTTPRSSAVVGRVASEQIEGTDVTKGLKFCSAATYPRAAAMALSLLPSAAMMESACWSSVRG